jgi:dienelactone hydrolase
MRTRASATLLPTLILAACAIMPRESGGAPSATEVPNMSPVALDPTESVRAELDDATLYDVSFASAGGGRATGWMVVPASDGPHPAIVYVHGSETDRDDFLDEATAMAGGGAVTLTLDAPFARRGVDRTGTLGNYFTPGAEAALNQQMLDDVSAAFDLLAARPDVDPERLAFVGHSWGASLGAVLAARDARSVANVLITPRPSWTGFLRRSQDDFAGVISTVGEEGWEAYLASMQPYDAVPAVSSADGEALYLQFGTQDDVVVATDVDEWVAAAPAGTRIDRYPAGHALDAAAVADRAAWLVERLGLDPIGADALAAIGLPDEASIVP